MADANIALWLHVVTVAPLFLFKLMVLLVGYLIARLGYDLLLRGAKGEFKFHTEYRAGVIDLVSVSPGIFFVFLGAVLIVTGIVKDKPFDTEFTIRVADYLKSEADTQESSGRPVKPLLPPPGRQPDTATHHQGEL